MNYRLKKKKKLVKYMSQISHATPTQDIYIIFFIVIFTLNYFTSQIYQKITKKMVF